MILERRLILAGTLLALLIVAGPGWTAAAQTSINQLAPTSAGVPSLGLPPSKASELQERLKAGDYIAAEKLLLAEIGQDQHSPYAARLLTFLGGIYFLKQDFLQAAIAWKKSDAITPLSAQVRFSLAMAYIRMGHPEWAHAVLHLLATKNPKDPLYPYWLGRLAFDAHSYSEAIGYFKNAVTLAPGMARAYDNLGLCYYHQNENALAVQSYRKAIELDHNSTRPSAWPYLNLATVLEFLNKPDEAEADLREAIRLDSTIAPAHFQLGNILEKMGRMEEAISEFQKAARLDATYAEPHFALARVYNRLGRKSAAQAEVQSYLRLHNTPTPGAAPADGAPR